MSKTTRFLVKRNSQFQYSGRSDLGSWIPLSDASYATTFETRDEAFAAIGRYVAQIGREGLYSDEDLGRYVRMWVVEVAPPASTEWTEVTP